MTLSTKDVAALLGVSEAAVRQKVHRGQLKALRRGKGNRLLFDTRAVDALWRSVTTPEENGDTMIDHYEFWKDPPLEPSPGLRKWLGKAAKGWKPNGRIRSMGREACSGFYDCYQWEMLHILRPVFDPESYYAEDFKAYRDARSLDWIEKHGLFGDFYSARSARPSEENGD